MKFQLVHACSCALFVLACSDSGPSDTGPDASPDAGSDTSVDSGDSGSPPTTHCAFDESCPEVLIEGDPFATLGAAPAPFRGYGDPAIREDPDTGTLFLTYSWLDVLIGSFGPPPIVDLGIRTHLARSDDGGRTFQFVRAINETTRTDTPRDQWSIHEVSTLRRRVDGTWEVQWLQYAEPVGAPERLDFFIARSVADQPEMLGDMQEPWIGFAWSPAGVTFPRQPTTNLPEIADCTALTEPSIFSHEGQQYLAAHCIVVEGGRRLPNRERIVLLRETTDAFEYVAALTTDADAVALGADVLTQPELTTARDGTVLLLAVPKVLDADPAHRGCVVYELDLNTGALQRNAGGAVIRHRITADGNGLGPGLCSYDPASETGVLLVITQVDLSSDPVDILFSLRATGVHP